MIYWDTVAKVAALFGFIIIGAIIFYVLHKLD
jgi:hypothetical protein